MSELKRGLFRRKNRGESSSHDPSTGSGRDLRILEERSEDAFRPTQRGKTDKKGKKKRRRLTLAVLPTMLTLGNGVCGLGAIAIAVSDEKTLNWPLEQKLLYAGLLIFGGMLFDALDGSAARMTGQESEFGAQLDSLCDAVTFGTAPAVIIWGLADALPQRLVWAIGVLFTLCVLIRLARFNVETEEDDSHESFEGLPSPAAAGTLAAFAIAMPDLKAMSTDPTLHENVNLAAERAIAASHYYIPALALVLAFLMVSRFRYPHIVSQWVRGRRAPHQIGQALFALGGVFLLHWLALPLAFCYYAFGSPIRAGFMKLKNRSAVATE